MINVENQDADVASNGINVQKMDKMELQELKPPAPAPFGINVIAE